ncbi:hypothetical protein KXQ82_01020 [Mucilaginibacter sp. HMF5004]|uniref:hypothetical protein n=1 Tax=Mucilaginibacter rivuli TaxID=2857527 RepID=UPI001C5FF37B|nr:hypothetical protein [Mucilaginibacter rivuli]MBW4888270.1 hypothetical protein [Mucilaginibacter rivuli]
MSSTQKLSLHQQLDKVLFSFKIEERNQKMNISYVNDILMKNGVDIEVVTFREILRKIHKDGYIEVHTDNDVLPNYYLTIEGSIFQGTGGYEKQLNTEQTSNKRRNVREFALTWGTVLAGLAASALLVWQIYSYFHPSQIPLK